MILFPNLGLKFENVGTGISILGFEVTYFGIILGVAILLGIALTLLEAYHNDQCMDEYLNLFILIVPLSLIGARIYYVMFQLDSYKNDMRNMFQLRQGGLEFYGALIVGIIVVLIYANVQKVSVGRIMDTASVGIAAGQILCTLGAYFNKECFGEYTDGLLAMQIPLDTVSYSSVSENMRKHIEMVDGQRYIQVSPLFLAAFIWSIIVLTIVILYKYRRKYAGELFLVYLLAYSFGRFLMEGARADALIIPGSGWRVARVTAVVMIVISVLMMLYIWTQNDKARMKRVKNREAKRISPKSRKKMF